MIFIATIYSFVSVKISISLSFYFISYYTLYLFDTVFEIFRLYYSSL